jgi:hypothetical protein
MNASRGPLNRVAKACGFPDGAPWFLVLFEREEGKWKYKILNDE